MLALLLLCYCRSVRIASVSVVEAILFVPLVDGSVLVADVSVPVPGGSVR
jgi:hypothetical protein